MKLERMKLESSGWRRKVTDEVSKFWFNLEKIKEAFQLQGNFPTQEEIFQLRSVLSKFKLSNLKFSKFSFVLSALSNYMYTFQEGRYFFWLN